MMRSLTLTQTRWILDQVRDIFRICGSRALTLSGMTYGGTLGLA